MSAASPGLAKPSGRTTGKTAQPASRETHNRRPASAASDTASTLGMGLRDEWTYDSSSLSDRVSFSVNVASGNFVLASQDVHLAGVAGHDLDLGHFYNSLYPSPGGDPLVMGGRWKMFVNGRIFANGDFGYVGVSGYEVTFTKQTNGSFVSPPGIDATLARQGDGTYLLTFHQTGEKQQFAADGGLMNIKDRNGNAITLFRNATGKIDHVTDSHGSTASFAYDSDNQVSQITLADGRILRFGYLHTSGDMTSYTEPSAGGGLWQYTYDTSHLLTQIQPPFGGLVQVTYDGLRRVTSVTRGVDPATTYAYQAAGMSCPGAAGQTVVTDQLSHATTYCFDASLRVTKVVDPLGHTRSTDYTSAHGGSNCIDDSPCSVTDALGKTTTFAYDATGENLLSSQSPLQGTSNRPTFTYGSSVHPNYPTRYTDPQGNSWNYAYDEGTGNTNGNLTSKTEGLGGQNPIRFTYNTDGTTASATDAKGAITRYSYNAAHDLVGVDNPAPLGDESMTYDAAHRLATYTDGMGRVTSYAYDALDRVITVTPTTSAAVTYSYDASGNLKSAGDSGGIHTYVYDNANRLLQETPPGLGNLGYSYDGASNLTNADGGQANPISYTYDAADQLTSMSFPGASSPITFSYDANGNRTQINYPNGVSVLLGYDDSQRLISVVGKKPASGVVLTSFTYSYTNGTLDSDLRRQVTSVVPGQTQQTLSYCYDSLNRLLRATTAGCGTPGGQFQYAYDANGNLTSKTINGVTSGYTYNAANQITTSGFAYDADGNQTASPTLGSVSYNDKDQTTSITPPAAAAIAFGYLGTGQSERKSKGSTTYADALLGTAYETRPGPSSTVFLHDAGGTLLAELEGGNTYYFLFDGLGSVAAVTDSSGNVVRTFTYEPFGKEVSTTGTLYEPFRYTGGYYDSETGLLKFGERYYDASIGRWTQMDAIDAPLATHGWNRYAYAGDDPVNTVDPTGSFSLHPHPLRWAKGAYHSAGHYWRGCVTGGLTGAAYGAFAGGPLGASYGFALGCGTEIGAEMVERHVRGNRGKAVAFGIRLGFGLYGSKLAAREAYIKFFVHR
jgi:RHS repeat-associated protein